MLALLGILIFFVWMTIFFYHVMQWQIGASPLVNYIGSMLFFYTLVTGSYWLLTLAVPIFYPDEELSAISFKVPLCFLSAIIAWYATAKIISRLYRKTQASHAHRNQT